MCSEDVLKNNHDYFSSFFFFFLQKVITLHSPEGKNIAREKLLTSLYTNHFSGLLGKALEE